MNENTSVATLMTKESNFELSEEKLNEWTMEAMGLLGEYDYDPSSTAVRSIFRENAKQKGWLYELFKKSEYYNGNGQIVLPAKLKRPVDKQGIKKFKDWFRQQYIEMMAEHPIMIGLHDANEYKQAMERIENRCCCMIDKSVYNGLTKADWEAEYNRMNKRWKKMEEEVGYFYRMWSDKLGRYVYVTETQYNKFDNLNNMIYYLFALEMDETPNILGEERTQKINNFLANAGLKTRAVVGQRVNKFVGKILKELGMNHIVDRQTVEWVDDNGEVHQREKDMGYNYYYALLGDSINPLEYEREIVISIMPIDFWTMSFGYKWASCHTIDKTNRRRNGSDNYQGCYSGGTESYMLDSSSVIMYVRPTDAQIKEMREEDMAMEMQSKFKRCIFYLGEDKLIQSRVYPDGRDGGEEGLAAQLRAIMQKTIADLYETPNMWTIKKGTYACESEITTASMATHYADYAHYDDCNVSYLRRINGDLNHNRITVGASPICPSCGSIHSQEEWITCECCCDDDNIYNCDRCGDRFNIERDSYIYTGDGYYCCEGCAKADGYVETEDDGWHFKDDCYYDSYSGEWYYDDSYGVWTEDGNWYHSEDNAERDGYAYASEEGGWYDEDDVYVDYEGTTFYKPNYPDAVEIDGDWYMSEEDAINNGYELNEDGEWVMAA